MNIEVFTATGQKKGTLVLPSLFESRINQGLMHQAVMRQQSNRRNAIAHAKNRHEVAGSTRKLYAQKHTGRARRGSIRSPLLRGGGKAFGPRSEANFRKNMPKAMRRAALLSCLSFQAKKGIILGLEDYPNTIKTKEMSALLKKLPVELGRRILVVVPERHQGLEMSARNIPGVKTLLVSYLNPEDVLASRSIIFLGEAIAKAEEWLGEKKTENPAKTTMPANEESVTRKRTSSGSLDSSDSSVPSNA
ncbi:50S ribosomal protein L4 [Candidatus Peregrinibacteria bacterium]|nr:50S ribosomal protein L4 [Candidatus Peregrinibacteria bacterium]MBI3815924.1 50S ribosomal protein L4 [Candidatus Peregrinibacteria bacterium]